MRPGIGNATCIVVMKAVDVRLAAETRRLKEFSEQREVDQYLSASGYLPSGVRPFFIALPKVSALQPARKSSCRFLSCCASECDLGTIYFSGQELGREHRVAASD